MDTIGQTLTKLELLVSDEEYGKIMRYITKYGGGGFQNLMRKIVLRNIEVSRAEK